jgi:hypothetical protein
MHLSSKGLAEFSTFGHARITPRGIEEAERIMQSSYAEKESRVLRKLYDMGGVRHIDSVVITDLARELGMQFREINEILIDLEERKGLIHGDEHTVRMKPTGIEIIESGGQRERTTPGTIYNVNIEQNYGGIQQGGHGNVQNITLTYTNNPDFDRALVNLVELICTSQISDDDKQELEEEVGKINKLALREPAPGLLDRAKSRLDMIKLALTGTDIAIKAAPHLDTLWELIKQRFGT